MTILWVIGNGFDLQHEIKSTYLDFGSWLHKSVCISPSSCVDNLNSDSPTDYCRQWGNLPEISVTPSGETEVDDKISVPFICQVISTANPSYNAWSNLEANLSGLEFSTFFDELESVVVHGEEKLFRTAYQNEDLRDAIIQSINQLPTYLQSWVRDELTTAEPEPDKIIKEAFNSAPYQFLTFNYTSTLQDLYDIPESKICHIHGRANDRNSILRFGHDEAIRCVQDEFEGDWKREVEFEIDKALKKEINTSELDKYRDLEISAIIFFGFGFGPADRRYLTKLAEVCQPDIPVAILAPEHLLGPTITRATQQLVPQWRPPIELTLETPNLPDAITRMVACENNL